MFVFKHAILNLRRHIWSYILISIVLFLLILGTMVTNTIYTSAELFIDRYSKKFMTSVTILEPDLSNTPHEKKLTKEQYIKFGDSKYVNGMKMVGNTPISFENLKTIALPSPVQFQELEGAENEKNYYQAIANWFGAQPADLSKEISERGMEISEGSIDLSQNQCIVSSELAQLNQLKIGDAIQVVLTGNEKMEKQTLIIAGIYQPKKQGQAGSGSQLMNAQGNDIFTNWQTLHDMENFDYLGYNSVSYELKNIVTFDKFLKEIKEKGLPNDYQVVTNEANMKLFLSPVNGVKTVAGSMLVGFLIFGNFGLALFSIGKFRQRQTELYILRNIGITNKQIIKSLAIELGVVISVCFSLAFMATKWLVQSIADWQLGNQKQLMGNVDQLFSLMASEKNEFIPSIPMVINAHSFLVLLGMTSVFFITIISIDSYKIFKFDPIEFLLERNLDER